MRPSTSVAALLVGGLSAVACESPDLGNSEQAIINGTLDPDDVAIVGLVNRSSSCGQDDSYIDCSATLVAPRVVVTAAHCLGFDPPNKYSAFFGTSFAAGGTRIPVVGGGAHPAYDEASHANDVAAFILESDAPSNAVPIPMHTTSLPDLTGTMVRMVGYGVTNVDATVTGDRMTGTGRITAVGAEDITMEPAPGMSCHGDSGGPVIADLGSGEELIGVTSYGDPVCATTGVAIRIDRQLAFVQQVIDEAAAMPSRRTFDPSESFCGKTCTTDAECPSDTVCFSIENQPRHCVYRGLPAGDFGRACTMNEGETLCVTMPDGACRQYLPCDVDKPPGDGGCCSAGSAAGIPLVPCALVFVAMRRRRRRSA